MPGYQQTSSPIRHNNNTLTMTSSSSQGILSLPTLLATMSPTLDQDTTYVFATTTETNPFTTIAQQPQSFEMFFREAEGWTLIVEKADADKLGLDYTFPCKKITLNVHSSLEAVGFLAAVTTRLAQEVKIGVNPVSGFYHDHLFVPEGREGEVMSCLGRMVEEAKGEAEA